MRDASVPWRKGSDEGHASSLPCANPSDCRQRGGPDPAFATRPFGTFCILPELGRILSPLPPPQVAAVLLAFLRGVADQRRLSEHPHLAEDGLLVGIPQ